MNDSMTCTLRGVRFAAWTDVVPQLSNMTCAWQSVIGFETGTPPAQWPVGATHLWAWSSNCWAIVRPCGGGYFVGELTPGDTHADDGEVVAVERFEALVWGRDDGRISPSARKSLPSTCHVLSVAGTIPLEFIELTW